MRVKKIIGFIINKIIKVRMEEGRQIKKNEKKLIKRKKEANVLLPKIQLL